MEKEEKLETQLEKNKTRMGEIGGQLDFPETTDEPSLALSLSPQRAGWK